MLDLIQWRARKTPEAPALFFNGRWYTYREMEGRANRLANRLRSLGIVQGDRIGVLANNHPVHFDLLLAAPKLGIVYTPFNPRCSPAELAAMAALTKPAMVFADSRNQDLALAMDVQWTRLSDYREWLMVGSLDTPTSPQRALTVDDIQICYFTPRGAAQLPYRQVLLNARHAADTWGLTAQDATVHCLPCFGPELGLLCLPVLYRGGRVVLMSGFDSDEYLGHLALHRITVSALTPMMLRQLCDYGDFEEADLSSLNWFASIGAPPSRSVRNTLAARGLPLRTLVPLTEAGPTLFNASLEDAGTRPTLLGLPLPDQRVALARGDGSAAEEGEAGCLRVSGPMLFAGYLDAPEQTALVLDQGWLDTGLMLKPDADGQYRHLGRSEDAFVSGGVQVHPGEIEAALLELEAVIECAVTGIADAQQGLRILAAVVLQDGASRDELALASALAPMLPEALRPAHYLRLKQLPRDAWGQVQRSELTALFVQGRMAARG